jgi:small subunit ribosomal protein S16
MGRKKRPYYRIVAVDSRAKRDGACIERLGYYHPMDTPATVLIEGDKALKWLRDGAIPSQTVLSLFKREGLWLRHRLEKRGLPQAQIDTMMGEWFAIHKKTAAAPGVAPKAKKAAPAKVSAELVVVETVAAEPAVEPVAAAESPAVEAAPVEVEAVAEAPVEEPREA